MEVLKALVGAGPTAFAFYAAGQTEVVEVAIILGLFGLFYIPILLMSIYFYNNSNISHDYKIRFFKSKYD